MPATIRALVGALAVLLGCALQATADQPGAATALTPEKNICAAAAAAVAVGAAQWNGWGRDLDNSRYQPEPAIRATDVTKLAVKWAYGYQGGAAYGQPTIVDDRLFVSSSAGRVYSLDAKTGCTYWTFDAAAGTRTAISIGELGAPKIVVQPRRTRHSRRSRQKLAHVETLKPPSAAFFGDDSGTVYALDAKKGTLLWKTQVEGQRFARISGAPTLYRDRLYVPMSSTEAVEVARPGHVCCTFRGSVAALDIFTGQVVWKTYTIPEEAQAYPNTSDGKPQFGPSGVAIGSSPTVDAKRGLLYVGTGNSYTGNDLPLAIAILALDLFDGKLRWSKRLARAEDVSNDAGFASSPILRNLGRGKQIILAERQNGVLYGLDPDRAGELVWQTKILENGTPGDIQWGPAADHRSLYTATSDGLIALALNTGAKRWYRAVPQQACAWGDTNCRHAQTQAVTVMPGIAFSGSLDGHLRAYSTIDGKIVWDFDTAKEFATVNGVKASGGSLDYGGPTIVNGILYLNSANGPLTGQPGNALIAFSVGGK